MNTQQRYKIEDLCTLIVTSVKDPQGKGSTQLTLYCDRELDDRELALIDEVCTDTLNIQRVRNNVFQIEALKQSGLRVFEADGVTEVRP